MIYKICTRCGKRIPEGTTCSCQKIRKAESDRQYDRHQRDKKATDFYRSPAWIQTRQRILNIDQHIDVYMYMTQGKVIPADTVHHIIPLREDWNRRLDSGNLMSLHHDTHSLIEREYSALGTKVMAPRLKKILTDYRAEHSSGEIW